MRMNVLKRTIMIIGDHMTGGTSKNNYLLIWYIYYEQQMITIRRYELQRERASD